MQRMDARSEMGRKDRAHRAITAPPLAVTGGRSLMRLQQVVGNHGMLRRRLEVQAKPIAWRPGDVYEQEADRVAAAMLRMRTRVPQEHRQAKEDEPRALPQPQASLRPAAATDQGATEEISASCGSGVPLAESVRAFFEPRLGYRLSEVRIHANPPAFAMARALKAQAFVVGRDIVFGSGRFAPETGGGRRLLAHELIHVLQQRGLTEQVGSVNAPVVQRCLRHAQAGVIQRKDYSEERYNPDLGMCGLSLLFDGTTLVMNGKKTYRYLAVSGRPDDGGNFDYSPARQRIANIGPIPEGTYWINPAELWTRSRLKFWLAEAWGNYRITIHPFTTTETHRRGGFFIHGGSTPGSAGCIDLTANMDQFVNDLKAELSETRGCQIHLSVRYPRPHR